MASIVSPTVYQPGVPLDTQLEGRAPPKSIALDLIGIPYPVSVVKFKTLKVNQIFLSITLHKIPKIIAD